MFKNLLTGILTLVGLGKEDVSSGLALTGQGNKSAGEILAGGAVGGILVGGGAYAYGQLSGDPSEEETVEGKAEAMVNDLESEELFDNKISTTEKRIGRMKLAKADITAERKDKALQRAAFAKIAAR